MSITSELQNYPFQYHQVFLSIFMLLVLLNMINKCIASYTPLTAAKISIDKQTAFSHMSHLASNDTDMYQE